jgi:hypothetical protein
MMRVIRGVVQTCGVMIGFMVIVLFYLTVGLLVGGKGGGQRMW